MSIKCCNHMKMPDPNTKSLLAQDELELLGSMLQFNKDIFAWTHLDMPESI
ncbi:hypothetical protein CK203_063767 [Vitis vinifera]|uniref:Uncharacterized protein n=1 Tax=Vitis vinifera TaxID=29760 RepID=A0A438GZS8_VITVI|nr:hypothetical protein CK203_063767 [Vitis vinifera]